MNIAFSVSLPFRKVKSLVVSNDQVLVSDSDQMVAITAEGQMVWHLRFERPIGKMVVAPSGDIVGICDGGKQLTVRSPNLPVHPNPLNKYSRFFCINAPSQKLGRLL